MPSLQYYTGSQATLVLLHIAALMLCVWGGNEGNVPSASSSTPIEPLSEHQKPINANHRHKDPGFSIPSHRTVLAFSVLLGVGLFAAYMAYKYKTSTPPRQHQIEVQASAPPLYVDEHRARIVNTYVIPNGPSQLQVYNAIPVAKVIV